VLADYQLNLVVAVVVTVLRVNQGLWPRISVTATDRHPPETLQDFLLTRLAGLR